MAGGGFLILSLLVTFLGFLGNVVGLASPRWYVVTLPAGENQMSLWRTCTTGNCSGTNFDDLSAWITQCNRPSEEIAARFNACRVMCILSAVFLFFAFFLTVGARLANGSCPWASALFCILLALVLLGATIAIWIVSLESWLYCNKTFCGYTAGTYATCANGFGYSFILVCLSFPLTIMSFTFTAASFYQTSKAHAEDQWAPRTPQRRSPSQRPLPYSEPAPRARSVSPTQRGRSVSPTTEPYNGRRSPSLSQLNSRPSPRASPRQSPRSQSPQSRSPRAQEKDLPEGDWAFDADSGLYWSEKEQLYLDRESEQYYDPFSTQWYDPATDTWYVHNG